MDGVEQSGARSEQPAPSGKCQVGAPEMYLLCCDGASYCGETEPVEGWMNETDLSVRTGAAVAESVPQERSRVKSIATRVAELKNSFFLSLCESQVVLSRISAYRCVSM